MKPGVAAVMQMAVPFIWLGMVLAISFLETPLKFRAPGITVPLGLGVGRLIFRALNAAELALARLHRHGGCQSRAPARPRDHARPGTRYMTACSRTAFSVLSSSTSLRWTWPRTCR